MKKKLEYINSVWKQVDVKGNFLGTYIYISEIDCSENVRGEDRRIVHYPNGKVKAANSYGGYEGEQIAHGHMYEENLLEELNNPPELVTIKISKQEFEREWEIATSQPGFYLKPYSEYTEEDYKMRNI